MVTLGLMASGIREGLWEANVGGVGGFRATTFDFGRGVDWATNENLDFNSPRDGKGVISVGVAGCSNELEADISEVIPGSVV